MKTLEHADLKILKSIAKLVDTASGLPTNRAQRYIDGAWVEVLLQPGEPGWTLTVRDIKSKDDGSYEYEIDDELAQKIVDAKAKPGKDKTDEDKILDKAPDPKDKVPVLPDPKDKVP